MYYHLLIQIKTRAKNLYVYNLDESTLLNDYIKPYSNGGIFIVDGYQVSKESIVRFKISETSRKSDTIVSESLNSSFNAGIVDLYIDDTIVFGSNFKDVTSKYINCTLPMSKNNKNTSTVNQGTNVFVVYGHDDNLLNECIGFLKKFDINPVVLKYEPNCGRTIIEKIEDYTDEVAYAIVLYTPCDICKNSGERETFRARQNVVFEHGYLTAKLGRKNVAVLVKGKVEKPGDIDGVIYIEYNENWELNLVKEMKTAGLSIDLNKFI